MRVNGIPLQIKDMVEAHKFGPTEVFTRGTGRETKQTEEEGLYTLTEMFMMENGRMTKLMAMVNILTPMGLLTKVPGKRINSTVKAESFGLMGLNIVERT